MHSIDGKICSQMSKEDFQLAFVPGHSVRLKLLRRTGSKSGVVGSVTVSFEVPVDDPDTETLRQMFELCSAGQGLASLDSCLSAFRFVLCLFHLCKVMQ